MHLSPALHLCFRFGSYARVVVPCIRLLSGLAVYSLLDVLQLRQINGIKHWPFRGSDWLPLDTVLTPIIFLNASLVNGRTGCGHE